ncbi:Protein CBG17755 [Caenorhabditis briggsae]|uniref:Protein CBG17755 n=1 Tax=Caenorhabditis briggsae TaxID=6238 RepID=A8XRQ6_CAEBR|nr:Protein CBG17755 [Caenorhabditis briggsae]CAP35330.2 Protein CBG17755 [Caenorhabditis briggsae]
MFKSLIFSVFLAVLVFARFDSDEEPCKEEDVSTEPTTVSTDAPANLTCESGWKSFQRPSGEWCMKIVYENSVTQPVAEQRCQAQGATLTGLQNQLEMLYVTYTVTNDIFPESGSVWIGMKRTEACANSTITGECKWDNSFVWTDKSATGIDGVNWAYNQPDNARELSQHCVILNIGPSGYWLYSQIGLMDDMGCTFDFVAEDRKALDVKAFVCGKKPSAKIN